MVVFIDKYLDVVFTPQGDSNIEDRDELDEAYYSGEITKEQYESAIKECDMVFEEYCLDVAKTEMFCDKILDYIKNKIAQTIH